MEPDENGHVWDGADPIYGVVIWCSLCMAGRDSEEAEEKCPGDWGGPTDAEIERYSGGDGGRSEYIKAWEEHRDTHR